MSKLRPGRKEKLEAKLLALAKERAELEAGFVQEMLEVQRELHLLEGGGGPRDQRPVNEAGPRIDDLDSVPEAALAVGADEFAESVPAGCENFDVTDWKARCARITQFSVSMFRQIADPGEKRPQLAAMVALYAIGAPALPSKREVAEVCGLSPEWVSRRAELVMERFKLPRNEYNKPMAAVETYRDLASMRNRNIA